MGNQNHKRFNHYDLNNNRDQKNNYNKDAYQNLKSKIQDISNENILSINEANTKQNEFKKSDINVNYHSCNDNINRNEYHSIKGQNYNNFYESNIHNNNNKNYIQNYNYNQQQYLSNNTKYNQNKWIKHQKLIYLPSKPFLVKYYYKYQTNTSNSHFRYHYQSIQGQLYQFIQQFNQNYNQFIHHFLSLKQYQIRKNIHSQKQLVNVLNVQYFIQSSQKKLSCNYNCKNYIQSQHQSLTSNPIYLCYDNCTNNNVLVNLKVITQRVPYRLSNLIEIANRKLSFVQIKFVLSEILQAYISLQQYNIYPECTVNKIGFNSKGNLKYWINQIYGLNDQSKNPQNQSTSCFFISNTFQYKIHILKSIFATLIQNIQEKYSNQFQKNLPLFVISNTSKVIQNRSGKSFYIGNQHFFKTVKNFFIQQRFLNSQDINKGFIILKEQINNLNKLSLKQYNNQLFRTKNSNLKIKHELKVIQFYDSLNKKKNFTYQYNKKQKQTFKNNENTSVPKHSGSSKKLSKKSLKNKTKSSKTLYEKQILQKSGKENVKVDSPQHIFSTHKNIKEKTINFNQSQESKQRISPFNLINNLNTQKNLNNSHQNAFIKQIPFEQIQNKAFLNNCALSNQMNKRDSSISSFSKMKKRSIKQKSLFKMKTQANQNILPLIRQIQSIRQQMKESDKSQQSQNSNKFNNSSQLYFNIIKKDQTINQLQTPQAFKLDLNQNESLHLLQAQIQRQIKKIDSQVQIITNKKKNLFIDLKHDSQYHNNSILLHTPSNKCLPSSSYQSNIYNKLDQQSWKYLQCNINKSKVDSTINGSYQKSYTNSITNPTNSMFLKNSINVYGSITNNNHFGNYTIKNNDRLFTKNNPVNSCHTNNYILLIQNRLEPDKICQSKNQLTKNQEQQIQLDNTIQRRLKTQQNYYSLRKIKKEDVFKNNCNFKQNNHMFLTVNQAKDILSERKIQPKSQIIKSDEKYKGEINNNKNIHHFHNHHIHHLYHGPTSKIQNLSSRKSFTVSVFDQQESSDNESIILISAKNIMNNIQKIENVQNSNSSNQKLKREIHFEAPQIQNISNNESYQSIYDTPYLKKKQSSNQHISSTGRFLNKIIDSQEIINVVSSHNDHQLQKSQFLGRAFTRKNKQLQI